MCRKLVIGGYTTHIMVTVDLLVAPLKQWGYYGVAEFHVCVSKFNPFFWGWTPNNA